MKFQSHYLAAALAATLASGAVLAESLPASKATFAYKGLIALPSSTYDLTAPTADSGWTTVLKAQIKTANQKDLFINPSLQCGIVTDTTVKSLNGSLDTAEARGTIRVRVKITAPDGSTSYAEPNDTGATADPAERNTDGLVYCDRIQTLKAKFSGLNCDANLTTGEVTCADPEELQLILKTLNANSFNFVAADVASGVHTIEIQARTSANIGVDSQNGSLAGAEAFIGAGSATIEEVRMIQGNTGETLDLP
jgi:hypothetical protein